MTRRGVLVSYGFYDSKRSIGFVRFFVTTRRGVLVSYGFFSFSFFFVLMTLGIFIGGDSLEGVNLFHTSFRHHSQIIHSHLHLQLKKKEKSDNQLKKRKDNALNEYVINEL